MLRSLASWSASVIGSVAGWVGAYPVADPRRKEIFNVGRPPSLTADQALVPVLSSVVNWCRQIERATPLGRAVAEGLVADVVGTGIDVEPNTGDVKLNAQIRDKWHDFAEYACVDGTSLWVWQRQVVRDIAAAGSGLARFVYLPDRVADGLLPLAILPLEVEWLCADPTGPVSDGNRFIRGVEVDKYGRPVAYHLRNPESFSGGERVPAAEVVHVYERRRAQQTHGEPVLQPAVERTLQDSRLVETELKAAVATAAPAIAIESEANGLAGGSGDTDADSDPVTDIPAGATVRLLPGEKVETIHNNRPSQLIAPFRATIRGDIAAACRVSQYWLDRDPGRANYSSMRMDQMLTKRQLVDMKEAVGRACAVRVYQKAFEFLMISLGRPVPKDPVLLARARRADPRPDQIEYVDPYKDSQATKFNVASFLSSRDLELSARGKDWQQVVSQCLVENKKLDEAALERIVAAQAAVNAAKAKDPSLQISWKDVVAAADTTEAEALRGDQVKEVQHDKEK